MATVRQHVRISRPVDEVWAVVTDAGALASWFPGMESSSLQGDVRACTMVGGFTVKEQIVTNDAELRRLQYRIVEGIPFTAHLATIDVLDDPAGALVVYGADLEPGDGAQMSAAFGAALQGLRAMLET